MGIFFDDSSKGVGTFGDRLVSPKLALKAFHFQTIFHCKIMDTPAASPRKKNGRPLKYGTEEERKAARAAQRKRTRSEAKSRSCGNNPMPPASGDTAELPMWVLRDMVHIQQLVA